MLGVNRTVKQSLQFFNLRFSFIQIICRSLFHLTSTSIPLIWAVQSNAQLVLDSLGLKSVDLLSSQTVTRLTYTININGTDVSSLIATAPSLNSILVSNIYTGIPYKRYQIYIDGNRINVTSPATLSLINQAIRNSWSMANAYLFTPDDVLIPSINPSLAA